MFGMFVDGLPTYRCSTDDVTEARTTRRNAAHLTALDYFVYDFALGQNVATSYEDGRTAGKVGDKGPLLGTSVEGPGLESQLVRNAATLSLR